MKQTINARKNADLEYWDEYKFLELIMGLAVI